MGIVYCVFSGAGRNTRLAFLAVHSSQPNRQRAPYNILQHLGSLGIQNRHEISLLVSTLIVLINPLSMLLLVLADLPEHLPFLLGALGGKLAGPVHLLPLAAYDPHEGLLVVRLVALALAQLYTLAAAPALLAQSGEKGELRRGVECWKG